MRNGSLTSALALCGLLAFSGAYAQSVVDELERGGFLAWRFLSGNYEVSGSLSASGTLDASAPVLFQFADINNDGLALDVVLNLEELIPDLGIQRTIPLIAQVVQDNGSTAIIRWTGTDFPNECITVSLEGSQVQVLITELEGRLQGFVERISCQDDPLGTMPHRVHLRITDNGGDTNNLLRVRGYLLCIQSEFTLANARIYNMDWEAYAGGLPRSLGNVNGDCQIDDADLLQVLFNFGSSDEASDTNGDGTVDDADLLTVLFNFGTSV
ncbi:MAG: hypothetical protein N2045_12680 [Fimbriimonadales bacterium]|jgi:hypothetical protein|nr:hypothetical protein [Fimbriimonadales bacterium]GIV13992.1 MAG: hypothetical protein KatS3mg021_2274 [Fimbriimonadales bacterium]CUU03310.1 hypothetical protein GBSOP10_102559 [Armatimonadetes bacterium GBS]CUU35026.1 hypothetical protein GXSOP10_119120 [Armatimonadetes bacterium GXS]